MQGLPLALAVLLSSLACRKATRQTLKRAQETAAKGRASMVWISGFCPSGYIKTHVANCQIHHYSQKNDWHMLCQRQARPECARQSLHKPAGYRPCIQHIQRKQYMLLLSLGCLHRPRQKPAPRRLVPSERFRRQAPSSSAKYKSTKLLHRNSSAESMLDSLLRKHYCLYELQPDCWHCCSCDHGASNGSRLLLLKGLARRQHMLRPCRTACKMFQEIS